ncbi:hypothetical protein AAEU33_00180 [Chryseobacterium sp. Chry.R1]|uniref:hypothetical protein n=1 Tax=Chryseobacterium sp. Chry.R1 TaxID=3139392 RepID=UPI0031F79F65
MLSIFKEVKALLRYKESDLVETAVTPLKFPVASILYLGNLTEKSASTNIPCLSKDSFGVTFCTRMFSSFIASAAFLISGGKYCRMISLSIFTPIWG